MAALERRHLADLRFPEVTRALRALSADYVQRRRRIHAAPLEGRGKRAAFALFYGPLHFLAVSRIAAGLGLDRPGSSGRPIDQIVDLGCGTGAAGAALAGTIAPGAFVTGVDRLGWALEEAAITYRYFGLRHRTVRAPVLQARLPPRALVVAAYTVNELSAEDRTALLPRLIEHVTAGGCVLVVEPIARGVAPWWDEWSGAFAGAGGRSDEWRFQEPLPPLVRQLDRAAGLDHREQTARSLWLGRS